MNLTNKEPRKGTIAYYAAQKRKEKENSPEEIKKTEKIGNNDHKIGNAKVTHESLSEATIVAINTLLAEGKMSQYLPPFRANGHWVDDARGNSVLEANDHGTPKEIAAALNAFFGKKTVKEASDLNNVTIGGMKDKKAGRKDGEQCEEGDEVEITGQVNFKGDRGEIVRFGKDKRFVVVKLHNGGEHAFHSSDVTAVDGDEEDDEKEDEDTFYVAFYDEDEERSWIGEVTKAGGGKWHEKTFKGKPDYRWGQSYMSYLTPHDIMSWINKDYGRNLEIEGPYFDPDEAIEHVKHNWGTLEESAKNKEIAEAQAYTDFEDWKAAVLHSYPAQAKKIKFKGRMEGNKDTISAEVPGEDRSYGVWDQDEEKGVVLSEDANDDMLAKFMTELKAANIKASLQSGGKLEFNADDNDAVWEIYSKYMQKFRNAGWTATNIERAPGNPSLRYLKLLKPGITEAAKPAELKKAQEYFNRNADADMDYEDIISMLTSEDFSEEVAHEVAIDNGRIAPKKKVTEAVKDTIEAHGIKGMKRTPWRRTFKDADALNAWAEKYDAEIYATRDTDYAVQLNKNSEHAGGKVEEAAKAPTEKQVQAAKDAYESFGLKIENAKKKANYARGTGVVGDLQRKKGEAYAKYMELKKAFDASKASVEEGVVDSVKGFVKHQSNMAKANTRGWQAFGKGFRAALADRYETDPEENAKNEKTVKQSVRDSNRYRDFADGGKGFNSTKRTTAEKKWDDKVDAVKGKVKGAVDSVKKVFTKEGAANDRLQARARELLPVLKGPFKKKESVVAQCAELAAKYWNDAGLQKAHDIDDYIKSEMKKRGITEGVNEAIAEGLGKDMAKLIGIPVVAAGLAIGAQHIDDQKPHVTVGGQSATVLSNPGWGTIPSDALLVKGADGKMYKVFKSSGKGSGHTLYAVPTKDVKEGISPFKPGAKVKIIGGPKDCIGKDGEIGEVKTEGGKKTFVVDYDHDYKSDKPNFGCRSVSLSSKDIRLVRTVKEEKNSDEQLEVISKGTEKVLHTGNLEACKDFMRKHKSLKMDLRYKESGRLASYVL